MRENFPRCFDMLMKHEGGFSQDRGDPGNWTGGKVGVGEFKGTKYGIAANSFPHLDIASLTKEQARAIYKPKYWDTVGADNLHSGYDYTVFDCSVNSGPARAKQYKENVSGDPIDEIKRFNSKRLGFMMGLPIWGRYQKGWSKRVAEVEAASIKLWLTSGGASLIPLEKEAKKSDGKVKTGGTAAAGSATGAGGAPAGTALDPSAMTAGKWVALAACVVVLVGCTIWFTRYAIVHYQRSQAMRRAILEG